MSHRKAWKICYGFYKVTQGEHHMAIQNDNDAEGSERCRKMGLICYCKKADYEAVHFLFQKNTQRIKI